MQAQQKKLSRITFFSYDNYNIHIYIDNRYIGTNSVYINSGTPPDCWQPPAGLVTVELPAGTYALRFVVQNRNDLPPKEDTITLQEGHCQPYRITVSPPLQRQTYYDNSGYHEEDDEIWDIILYLSLIGGIVYLISLL